MLGIVIHPEGGDLEFTAVPADSAVAEERKPRRRLVRFEGGEREGDIAGGQKCGDGDLIMIRRLDGSFCIEPEGASAGKQVKPACFREGNELGGINRANGASAPAGGGQFRPIGNPSFVVGNHGCWEISHGIKGYSKNVKDET